MALKGLLAQLFPQLINPYRSERGEEVELTVANSDRYDHPSIASVDNSAFKTGMSRANISHSHVSETSGVKRMVSWTEKIRKGKVQPTTYGDPNKEIADVYHPVNSLTRELAFGVGDAAKHRTKNHLRANNITFFTPNDRRAKIATVSIVLFFMAIFIFFWYEGMKLDEKLAVKYNNSYVPAYYFKKS